MKVLLLGATGQLGREWQNFLQEQENDITLIPYDSSQLDITDAKKVTSELTEQQPDALINCAAFTNVDGAEEQKKRAQAVNVRAVEHLAKLSKAFDFKFIHYSTDYVFPGNKEDRETLPNGYPEDHLADPVNYYGQTKWEGEEAIRKVADNYLILRVSWLCGQYGSNFVKTMLKMGQERDKLQVVNDQWGSPSFAANVVENSLDLLQLNETGTFHIASKGLISWYGFAKAIFALKKMDVKLEAVPSETFPTKAKRPHFSKLRTAKIEQIPGSSIKGWKDGLKELFEEL